MSFKNLWSRAYPTPFKHKFLELQIYRDSTIAVIDINWTVKQDHAGLKCDVGLLGFCFDINFYDCRHWNDDKNQWEGSET
jgi:hypothetical protein